MSKEDFEKGTGHHSGATTADLDSYPDVDVAGKPERVYYDPSKESKWTRAGLTMESFKRAPGTTGGLVTHGNGALVDRTDDSPMLQQKMKPRHLTMIAVGGSIGLGLFVGSGNALARGGPAGILIAWSIIGVMMINVTQAVGEMAILYPVSGGFYTLAVRFLDPSFGFAMGWNYVLQWSVVLPLEISVASQTILYWTTDVPLAVWMTVLWMVILIVSLFGTLGFAEEEFWTSCLKLLVVVMFVLIGIVCVTGGGPASGEYSSYTGGEKWSNPGPFANGFKGVCSVFVTAAFSFAGTELVGLAASETPNPRATMPTAVKGTFWRITLVYISSLTMIGLLIPHDDPALFTGEGANLSPFVIALNKANIPGLDHLVNATICISVLSIGLSCVYAGSRTLTALAETGFAPKVFTYVDKSSRPLWSLCFILAWAPLAYIDTADEGGTIFNWLVAISGLSTLVTWGAICLCHIRFRAGWKAQGHSIEELPFQALGGVKGSWLGLTLIVLVLIAQFYVALWPIGGMSDDPGEVAQSFFMAYMAAPVMLAFYAAGYFWKRGTPVSALEMDLDTGRKSWLTVEEMRAYRAERAAAPFWRRIVRLLFTN
ncbi:amino-acid permease inda1 [Pterulicium gracile]|uniref:Amino-acid permease inda1 n=1 Tax=Pterulicium gracile TaxID=1884261 RepID=A0A5C3QK25_9AGAR|nr:amino-acid permease inda1 [Pterula gracilis]